jgi:PAS domain S-box-containing protein
MGTLLEHPSEEIKRLQRCINDLIGLLALPAAWSGGGDPSQIVRTLLDALLGMLRLDFVYMRLGDSFGGMPGEMIQLAPSQDRATPEQEICEVVRRWLGDDPQYWPASAGNPFADGEVTTVPLRLGLHGEIGMLVAGSRREGFPKKTEKLVLDIAANQAAIGLQEAHRLVEQKRVANQLEQRVSQRSAELAAVNSNLNKEIIERRRAEEGLHAIEVNFRHVVDSIPGLVCTMSPTGEIELLNRQVLEFFGKTAEQLKNWATSDVVHPDDLPRVIAAVADSLAAGTPYDIEHRCRRGDGVYRWFQVRALPVRNTDDHVTGWYLLLTDIDDRKRAEDAIRASERNLDQIINAVPALAWSARPDGPAEFFNRHYLDYMGLSADEAQGWGWTTAIHPDDLCEMAAAWRAIVASGRPGESEARLRRFDGEYRWFLFRANPLHDESNRIVKWYNINIDIEDRNQAQEQLRESELNLRQLTETIPEMLWRATPDGAIDYCNARVVNYTGFSAEEIMGSGWTRLLHPDDVGDASRVWMSCVATGTPYRVEVRIFHAADETYRWCVTNALPLRDEHGRILKWHGTVVDMHDWKRAQEELRNTQAELAHLTRVMTMGELAASIAHEINQPLASIITNGETGLRWLGRAEPDLGKAQELTRRMVADARRASDIIDRIRNMATRRAPMRTLQSLDNIIEESMVFLRHEFQSRGVTVSVDLAPELPPIVGDRTQLQQVVVNLAVNAVQAMARSNPARRSISIQTLLSDPETVCCHIEDSGPGIDPAHLPRLFDTFFTTKDSGMGMGLAISRSIIEAHGGRIRANNDSAFGGARFSFTLPVNGTDQASVEGLN